MLYHFKNNVPMSNLITPTFSEEDEKKVMELLAKLKAKFLSRIKLSPLWQGLSICVHQIKRII